MEYVTFTLQDIATFGLVAGVLLISLASALFFHFLPVKLGELEKKIVKYFTVYFFSVFFLYPLFIISQFSNELGWLEAISQIIYLISFYCLQQGLKIRKTGQEKALLAEKKFLIHISLFSIIQLGFLSLWLDSPYDRIAFLLLNLFIVCVDTLRYVVKVPASKSPAEQIACVVLWIITLLICFTFITLMFADSIELYLVLAIPVEILCLHIAVLSLASLIMSDSITTHYSNSITDDMTGLNNRRYFMEQTKQFLTQKVGKNDKTTTALITCDIDFFKRINDQHGHDVGDLAIIAFTNMLKRNTPKAGISARLGGEEFAIFLPEVTTENLEKLAETLREKTTQIEIRNRNSQVVPFTASFGVATFSYETDIEQFLRCADEAMYFAKKVGRNRVVFYDDIK